MPFNPRLADRLRTEQRTPAAAEWLIGQYERLLAEAPKNSQESSLRVRMDILSQQLTDYRAHRQQGDPYRTSSHTNLCTGVQTAVYELVSILNRNIDGPRIVTPCPEMAIEASVSHILENRNWQIACHGCGNWRRGCLEFGGVHYCRECVGRYTFMCTECNQRHAQNERCLQYDNQTSTKRHICLTCHHKSRLPQCSRCGSRFSGKPAGRTAMDARGDLTAEVLETELGVKCCYACAGHYRRVDCGHISDDPIRITTIPNVEDDDREQDEVRRNGIAGQYTYHCHDCEHAHRGLRGNDLQHWNQSKKSVGGRQCREVGTKRSYGVELEVVQPKNMGPMPEHMKAVWTAKHDASLPEYGVEMASCILKGDEGLQVIKELCDYAKEHKWSVDCRAGFHLHLGLAEETPEQVAAVAIGYLHTYHLWSSFVAPSRVRCKYCRRHKATPESVVNLEPNKVLYALTAGEHPDIHESRRVWCNWQSYLSRSTVEIRFHQGTLIYEKVANWIKSHARFVDWCVKVGSHKEVHKLLKDKDVRQQFLFLAQVAWKDRKLARWLRERAETLHGDMSYLPPSNRKLRLAGKDPKKVQKPTELIRVNGVPCFFIPAGGGTWVVSDSERNPGYFLDGSGNWSRDYKQFKSRAAAEAFARAFSISREAGLAYVEKTVAPPRPAPRNEFEDAIARLATNGLVVRLALQPAAIDLADWVTGPAAPRRAIVNEGIQPEPAEEPEPEVRF
jgi:hypothetical protein